MILRQSNVRKRFFRLTKSKSTHNKEQKYKSALRGIIKEVLYENIYGYHETEINNLILFEPEYLASLIGLEWDTKTGKVIRQKEKSL